MLCRNRTAKRTEQATVTRRQQGGARLVTQQNRKFTEQSPAEKSHEGRNSETEFTVNRKEALNDRQTAE